MGYDTFAPKQVHRQTSSSMEAPLQSYKTRTNYETLYTSSPTRALVEESEIFHEKYDSSTPLKSNGRGDIKSYCLIQSDLTSSDETIVKEEGQRQEVITFNDSKQEVAVVAPPIQDESVYDGFSANADLATYLARPVLINTTEWTLGSTVSLSIAPWDLYFNNASIQRKIQNYAFLACNLRLKVVINASPFYYGLAFGLYRPFIANLPGHIHDTFTYLGPLMSMTCRQRINILPAKSQGGEMLLPYINVRNWLRIGKRSDFQTMGDFHILSNDVLSFANATGGTGVTIQVFAWAEDIKVSGPTSELPLQSDEYETTGPISGIASNVASLAGTAEKILPGPFKPFAKATEIGADAISSIARLFGFTNVPVIDDVTAFKNLPFHAMASTEISCPFEKLTLDPKNELTIDNRVAGGTGIDELTIPYLVGKKNVWSLPNWAASDAAGTTLATINVSPMLVTGPVGQDVSTLVGTVIPVYQAPMTLVARSFVFWRGTMVYRFKFICTQYHRGRLGIIWDPAHGTTADYNYTENYSRVVDLAEEQEIVIKVPFMQPYPYLKTGSMIVNNIESPTFVSPWDENHHNGRLIVQVLNKQSSPVATADIFMYVETSMEDADFANPRDPAFDPNERTSYFIPQSSEEVKVVEDNIAKMEITQNPNLHKIYNGEAVFSMRQLFRRRSYYRTLNSGGVTTYIRSFNRMFFNRRPVFYGYDPQGIGNATDIIGVGSSPFNYVKEPLCNLFSPCFVGERGSVNYEVNVNGKTYMDTLAISRFQNTVSSADMYNQAVHTTGAYPAILTAVNYESMRYLSGDGCALTNTRTQTGLQIQAPMYSRFRFHDNVPSRRILGSSSDDTNIDNLVLVSYKSDSQVDWRDVSFDVYHSIGTDYQLLHFVNVPSAWIYGISPTPV